MKPQNLWKALPLAALMLCLQTPIAMAGATNTGNNTSATPGDNSTSTQTPANPGSDRRKGTTNTKDMKTPQSGQQQNSGSSSSSGGSNSGSSSSGSGGH